MNVSKKEELIKLLDLKLIDDAKVGSELLYALILPTRSLVISDTFAIRELSEGKYKTLFNPIANKVEDIHDLKLIFNYILTYEEVLYVNKLILKNR